eukprot:TRINITY_DN5764_c0_g1_i1.p2 TRINITY_DN5764_c0_g1~~TRINITY_DN5764_c0_g1_i1.p2  ORF type:complete len:199 (+),score=75.28 TRINITY_DN5764_c0_g1_i1:995-1591(+)
MIGEKLEIAKYIEKGLEVAERALSIYPNDLPSLNVIGNIYRNRRNYPKATEYFDRALKIDPYYEVSLLNRCAIFQESKTYEEGLEFITQWKKMDPPISENTLKFLSIIEHTFVDKLSEIDANLQDDWADEDIEKSDAKMEEHDPEGLDDEVYENDMDDKIFKLNNKDEDTEVIESGIDEGEEEEYVYEYYYKNEKEEK